MFLYQIAKVVTLLFIYTTSFALNDQPGAEANNQNTTQQDIDARRDASKNSTDPGRSVKEGGKAMNQKKKAKPNYDTGTANPQQDKGMETKGNTFPPAKKD